MIRAEGTGRGRSNETLHSPCSRPQSIPLPCKRWLIIQFTRPGTQWMISFHLRPQAETSDDTDGCLPGQRPCTPATATATPSVLLATTLPAGRHASPGPCLLPPQQTKRSSSSCGRRHTRACTLSTQPCPSRFCLSFFFSLSVSLPRASRASKV